MGPITYVIWAVVIFAVAVWCLWVFTREKTELPAKEMQLEQKGLRAFAGSVIILACVSSLVFVPVFAKRALNLDMFSPVKYSSSSYVGAPVTMENTLPKIEALSTEKWIQSDINDRKAVVSAAAAHSAFVLGIDTDFTVVVSTLVLKDCEYDPDTRTINIDVDFLANSDNYFVLKEVLKKVYIIYRHELASLADNVDGRYTRLNLMYDAILYREALKTSLYYEDDACLKRLQRDAAEYAEKETVQYFNAVNIYYTNQNKL